MFQSIKEQLATFPALPVCHLFLGQDFMTALASWHGFQAWQQEEEAKLANVEVPTFSKQPLAYITHIGGCIGAVSAEAYYLH